MINKLNLKTLSVVFLPLVILTALSSLDAVGMEDPNLEELLNHKYILPCADYDEEEEEEDDDDNEKDALSVSAQPIVNELQNDMLPLPKPEEPIYLFSHQPIVAYYHEKKVFSKVPLTIVCSETVDFSQVTLPEGTTVPHYPSFFVSD